MHARSAKSVSGVLLAAAAFGLTFWLGGCVGTPQTFYTADPVKPGRAAGARPLPRPAPAPVLSTSEKHRLFQDFQRFHGASDQATTTPDPVP